MSFETTKPLVLVVGATGRTVQGVLDALVDAGTLRVAALVRPSSQHKPAVESLRAKGVDIRVADVSTDSVETLEACLSGVDILLSLISYIAILDQKNILIAAKNASVGRVIPSDFGPFSPPGRRDLQDKKLAIRDFIYELGLPYTFIDVGWWMQLIIPHRLDSPVPPAEIARSHKFFGSGTVKVAVTSNDDIGGFVARIIADPRTLNQYVFCWSEEVTLKEVYALADRVSGQKLSDAIVHVDMPAEEMLRRAADSKAEYEEFHTEDAYMTWGGLEYAHSLYLCGDNTLENAKAEGALDARELYPDYKPDTLEEYAEKFYTKLPSYLVE